MLWPRPWPALRRKFSFISDQELAWIVGRADDLGLPMGKDSPLEELTAGMLRDIVEMPRDRN